MPQLNEVKISNLFEVFQHYQGEIVPVNVVKREVDLNYNHL